MSLPGVLGMPWSLAARARAELYRQGLLTTRRLSRPTISVGALEMGGTGKTPVVAALALLLQRAGHKPAIISRGYARQTRQPRVVSDGRGLAVDVRSAGDEPSWYARALEGIPVAVAGRRELAADLLEQRIAPPDVYLLDDAYQHVRVARNVNLLVVDAERPFWEHAPPPAGRLREGASAARRADAFIVVGPREDHDTVRRELADRYPERPAFDARSEEPGCWPLSSWDPRTPPRAPQDLGASCVAFAGIARPQRFFGALEAAGMEVLARRSFPDHHWYSNRDLDSLQRGAASVGAEALVTTEKDAVRLQEHDGPRSVPIHVWSHRLSLVRPEAFAHWLLPRLEVGPRDPT